MPILTMTDAERAFAMVKGAYEGYIMPQLKGKKAKDAYVFCGEGEYQRRFDYTYTTHFRAANAVLIPGVITSTQVNGFVTAEPNYNKRKIYIPKRATLNWTTLVHEAIHYFSNRAFYPDFYLEGGMRPFQVEGATEYLTRATSPGNADLQARKAYQTNYLRTESWLDSARGNYERMVAFLFQGTTTNMDAIHP
jgi:hypothetical protein